MEERFVITRIKRDVTEKGVKTGKTFTEVTFELPGEGFETCFRTELFENCSDPDTSMREAASREFNHRLEYILYTQYKELNVLGHDHGYDKNGKPYYICWYYDRDCHHYEYEMKRRKERAVRARRKLKDEELSGIPAFVLEVPIEAGSLDELELRLELALEEDPDYVYAPKRPEYHINFMKELVEKQVSSDDPNEFWWLLDLAVCGSSRERSFARKRIAKMSGNIGGGSMRRLMSANERRDEMKEYYRRRIAAERCKPDYRRFMTFLDHARDVDERYTNHYLARNLFDFSPATLSRIKQGTQLPTREQALQICIALQLSEEDRKAFMQSAGYYYPVTDRELRLEYYCGYGVRDYYVLRALIDAPIQIGEEKMRSLADAQKNDWDTITPLAKVDEKRDRDR